MPFHVRDPETNTLVRQLASIKRIGITDAIRLAVSNELKREEPKLPLKDRIAPIIARINSYPKNTVAQTDKEFWDDMCGEP